MDEAGRSQRRPDDAPFRNDDVVVDVHDTPFAFAGPGGARTKPHELEPEHSACAQEAKAGASADGGFRCWHGPSAESGCGPTGRTPVAAGGRACPASRGPRGAP